MSLAWHNLVQDRLRSALSIAGVGLALMLILILGGFLAGVYQSAALYLDHAPGSLVVARKEVKSFLVPGFAAAPGYGRSSAHRTGRGKRHAVVHTGYLL